MGFFFVMNLYLLVWVFCDIFLLIFLDDFLWVCGEIVMILLKDFLLDCFCIVVFILLREFFWIFCDMFMMIFLEEFFWVFCGIVVFFFRVIFWCLFLCCFGGGVRFLLLISFSFLYWVRISKYIEKLILCIVVVLCKILL